jgi:hypothetical protein
MTLNLGKALGKMPCQQNTQLSIRLLLITYLEIIDYFQNQVKKYLPCV